uniref:C2H2-type domain-containing protein n=1 Tax=Octopus bimaculoides TaxID=37653 RepID=A0A0L8I1Z2_OCTBM
MESMSSEISAILIPMSQFEKSDSLYRVQSENKTVITLQHGKRSLGGQRKPFKDSLKVSLKAFKIDPSSWEQTALDRTKWRAAVHNGARQCESDKKAASEKRKQNRKNNALKPLAPATIPCLYCSRSFQARIGLINHLRTHR